MNSSTWFLQPIQAIDLIAQQQATTRQQQLTKPAGSLGELERVVIELAGMQGKVCPQIKTPWISIFAGDHGVMEEKISAYPQEVTRQMLFNFAQGGACISVIAQQYQAQLRVVDCGTIGEPYQCEGVEQSPVAQGTHNFLKEPAMSKEQLQQALLIGKHQAEQAKAFGADVFIAGEMGIGNTCSASTIACLVLHESAGRMTGVGTGINSMTLVRKIQVVQQAVLLYRHQTQRDPLEILRCVGGFEIVAMVGAYIRAAQLGLTILVDGFISSVAALCAVKLHPDVRRYMLFAHQSAEFGHQHILYELNAKPLLQLGLRLGEGSGAGAAIGLLQLACTLHQNMATFNEAQVSDQQ